MPKKDLFCIIFVLVYNDNKRFCSKAQFPVSENLPVKLKRLLENCFMRNPMRRPLFRKVLQELAELKVLLHSETFSFLMFYF